MNKIFNKSLLILIILSFSYLISTAQTEKELSNWYLSANSGATLLWGDISDDVKIPFQKYFTPEQAYAFGMIGTYKLNSIFDLNGQLIVGSMKGNRTKWSGDIPANISFKGSFQELNLNLSLDFFNLILPYNESHPFTLYLKGGVGYTFYNSVKKDNIHNIVYPNLIGNALVFPWGGGARININEHYSLYFETTFHHSMKDEIDGHVGIGSEVNDIYTYTSIGGTYRFNKRVRKPKIDFIEEKPVDTVIAITTPVDNPVVVEDLNIVTVFTPSIVEINDTFKVQIRINKHNLNEQARFQQTLPFGMRAVNLNSSDAEFSFNDQVVSYKWQNFVESQPYINIEYLVVNTVNSPKEYSIPGIIFYTKNGVEKTLQFKDNIEVKQTEKVLVINEPKIETTVIETQTVSPTTTTTKINGLEYRVQVKAIYGGKSSSQSIAREYKIDLPINDETEGGYTKYTAGSFNTYEEAKAYKERLRNSNIPGAFVVAYIDGKRVSNIQTAIQTEKSGNNTLNTANNEENAEGLEYKIQISASVKSQSIAQLQSKIGTNDRIIETKHNNMYKYVLGNFSDKAKANIKLLEIQTKIPDAFIVRFKDGNRI